MYFQCACTETSDRPVLSIEIHFTARRYASAVYAIAPRACVFCLYLLQAGIISKRLHIGSRKQRRHTIGHNYSFLMQKIFIFAVAIGGDWRISTAYRKVLVLSSQLSRMLAWK